MRTAILASLGCSLLAVGCVASDPDADTGTGTDTDTTPTPDGDDPTPPPAPVAAGTYRVRSTIDLTVEAVLPEQIYGMVITLRDFSQHPARTLFDVAEDAGVPAVGDLRAALPSYLEDKLEGWIDGELANVTVDGIPLAQLAGNIAALAETSLSSFALDSELTIAGATATHTLVALDLAPAGLAATFPLGGLPAAITAATATCAQQPGTLSLGAHGYALPYGEYVWQALDARMVAERGTDIRGTLGAAVSCPTLATTISNKCYWGVCVGHRAELLAICERGLDEIVDRVHAKLAAMRFDALQLAQGDAIVVDADTFDGTWTAQINVGMGLRNAPATFTATR